MKTILVVENEPAVSSSLQALPQLSHQVVAATPAVNLYQQLSDCQPDLIILDLESVYGCGIDLCKQFKDSAEYKHIPVILLFPRHQKETLIIGFKAGADDYISKPVYLPDVLARIEIHLRSDDYYSGLEHQDLLLLLQLSETVSNSRNPLTILRQIVEKMSDVIAVSRCSIVSISNEDGLIVKASSDLPQSTEIKLQLEKYPEIGKVLETKQAVIVNDIKSDLLMESVRDDLQELDFNSIIVVPILKKESVIGTFFLRTASPITNSITDRIYKLAHIVANISANALENAMLFESLRNAQQYYEQKSIRDGLTKLYNHMHFYCRLEEEFSRAQRHATPLSCVFFDIDDFKAINDSFGHVAGDEVLQQISRTVLQVLRETDIAARYGGDEFAVILPNTCAAGALDLGTRLSQAIVQINYSGLDAVKPTVSMGVATFAAGNLADNKQLLQRADEAMYLAKSKGKGRVYQH